jgi:hypothetical protein
MAAKFPELTFTNSVLKAHEHYYGKSQPVENATKTQRSGVNMSKLQFWELLALKLLPAACIASVTTNERQ